MVIFYEFCNVVVADFSCQWNMSWDISFLFLGQTQNLSNWLLFRRLIVVGVLLISGALGLYILRHAESDNSTVPCYSYFLL